MQTLSTAIATLVSVPKTTRGGELKPEPQFDWPTYAREVGVRIRALREAREMTQDQLAGTAGIERSQLQNIERNRTSEKGRPANPQLLNIFRLAWALDVPPRWLLPDLDERPSSDYAATFDAQWPQLEVELQRRVTHTAHNHRG
ncbi:Transcriptional regulator, contains XRE-family HTH domain [Micrococcales bacterium KH10]|nr:Transcriptional regulator, contains XRE-family HTH domain [Micrococcales bacterium KH10]